MNLEGLELSFTANKITIASVFPIKCEETRPFGRTMKGGNTKYVIEAAAKGKFTTLPVWDSWGLKMSDTSKIGAPEWEPYHVSAVEIARDLLTHWVDKRLGTAQGHRPGIMAIAGDEPTAEELIAMHARQRPFMEGLVKDANGFEAGHKWREINELHREAGRYLGIDPKNAKWMAGPGSTQEWKECVYCREQIAALATICRVCREKQPGFKVIDEDSATIAAVEPSLTLAQRAAQVRAKQAAAATA